MYTIDSRRFFSVCFVLILFLPVLLMSVPSSVAHDPPMSIPTWAYLSVTPNPVGVGQEVFVNFFLDKAPPTANAQYGDRWHNFKVTVTKPDGSTEDLELGARSDSDAVGGSWYQYVPEQVGQYTFKFSFPGQTLAGENAGPNGQYTPEFIGDYFEPSESQPVTITVQNEKIPSLPQFPLPEDHWTRPINSENLNWYTISGNWLGLSMQSHGGAYYNASGNFNPYTTGPASGHIVWTKSVAPGGLIGGEFGDTQYGSSYYQTPQYEPKFQGIVINGVLYYMQTPGSSTYKAGWIAVDIRTGETIWSNDKAEPLLCGQVLSYISPNQFGGLSYLWSTEPTEKPNTGTTYGMFDAMTGNWILNIVNGTRLSSIVEADDGSLLGYYVNSTDNTLVMWNSTKCILIGQAPQYYGASTAESWMWRPPQGKDIPFSYGIQWAKPLETEINGEPIEPSLGIGAISSEIVLMRSVGGQSSGRWQQGYEIVAGYDAKTGDLKWGPIEIVENEWTRLTLSPAMQGKWFEFDHEVMTWSAYDLYSGAKVWGPSEPYSDVWGYYVCYAPIAAYDMLFTCDFGGYVHAYDIETGDEVWKFSTGSSGYETPYGNYPLLHIECVADGKIYVTGGHTYSPPLFRGSKMWCLDAQTGDALWSMPFFVSVNQASGVIADGYFVNINGYDNQLYCFGKGQSATTVSSPDTAVPKGTPILIKGTVTDQSPGETCLGIPAAGTPAISDESMSAWMEYLYMQRPKPTDATGVSVVLTAYGPDGEPIDIGTTTTDSNGKYGYTWNPPDEGTYHITATFEGSESYYRSEDTTYLTVGPAGSSTNSDTDNGTASVASIDSTVIVGVAVVAVIIAAIAVILAIRKR